MRSYVADVTPRAYVRTPPISSLTIRLRFQIAMMPLYDDPSTLSSNITRQCRRLVAQANAPVGGDSRRQYDDWHQHELLANGRGQGVDEDEELVGHAQGQVPSLDDHDGGQAQHRTHRDRRRQQLPDGYLAQRRPEQDGHGQVGAVLDDVQVAEEPKVETQSVPHPIQERCGNVRPKSFDEAARAYCLESSACRSG